MCSVKNVVCVASSIPRPMVCRYSVKNVVCVASYTPRPKVCRCSVENVCVASSTPRPKVCRRSVVNVVCVVSSTPRPKVCRCSVENVVCVASSTQDPWFAGAVLTLFVPVLPPRFCCTLALCSTGTVVSLLTQSTSCFVSQAGPSVTHTSHGGQQVSLLRLRQ